MGAGPDQLEIATEYAPSVLGPYMWHEFPLGVVERDLDAIGRARITTVRVLLSWDAFMPTDRQVSPRRMHELESLLNAARARAMTVVPVLFVQSLGDCVMLPAWAVDVRTPRGRVRVLTDGRVARGGARDIWADPLMIEAEVRWLDALLAAFAGHPAVAAWDLGHDPATTVRPRRIAHTVAWLDLLGSRVRAQGEQCRLTLGEADLTVARAMRPHLLAHHVDRLAIAIGLRDADAQRAAFLLWLLRRMTDDSLPLHVSLEVPIAAFGDGIPAPDGVLDDSAPTRSMLEAALHRVIETGGSGVTASAWADAGARVAGAPPCDRDAARAYAGIVDSKGDFKEATTPWRTLASAGMGTVRGEPAAPHLDSDDWYANLPESLWETRATWQGGAHEAGAIL